MRIVDESLLDEFRHRCEWCGLSPAEPHHIYAKGMGGGSRLDIRINLISLCRACHSKVHNGSIHRGGLLEIVAARHGITPPDAITQEIHRILRLPRDATIENKDECQALSTDQRHPLRPDVPFAPGFSGKDGVETVQDG